MPYIYKFRQRMPIQVYYPPFIEGNYLNFFNRNDNQWYYSNPIIDDNGYGGNDPYGLVFEIIQNEAYTGNGYDPENPLPNIYVGYDGVLQFNPYQAPLFNFYRIVVRIYDENRPWNEATTTVEVHVREPPSDFYYTPNSATIAFGELFYSAVPSINKGGSIGGSIGGNFTITDGRPSNIDYYIYPDGMIVVNDQYISQIQPGVYNFTITYTGDAQAYGGLQSGYEVSTNYTLTVLEPPPVLKQHLMRSGNRYLQAGNKFIYRLKY